MPCFTTQENSVQLELADGDMVDAAIRDVGAPSYLNLRHDRRTGELIGDADESELATIAGRVKVAYAKRAVERAARENGFVTRTDRGFSFNRGGTINVSKRAQAFR